MKKPYQYLYTTLFSVLLLLASSSIQGAFRDIELQGLDNKFHKLSDYIGQGKWVVLNIWGTRCPPCREEMPELVIFHENHKDKDAIVVGIAIDFPSFGYADKKDVATFVEDYFIDFPILLSDSSVTRRFGVGQLEALPTTYIFTPKGVLAGSQVGSVTIKALEQFLQTHVKKPNEKQ